MSNLLARLLGILRWDQPELPYCAPCACHHRAPTH